MINYFYCIYLFSYINLCRGFSVVIYSLCCAVFSWCAIGGPKAFANLTHATYQNYQHVDLTWLIFLISIWVHMANCLVAYILFYRWSSTQKHEELEGGANKKYSHLRIFAWTYQTRMQIIHLYDRTLIASTHDQGSIYMWFY